jgi:hypothetical protein
LHNKGVNAIVVCTDVFFEMASVEASDLGCPSLPIISVPHPLGGIPESEVRQKGKEAADKIIEIFQVG